MEGSILLTSEAADLVRMEGLLVKRPSFWTRKVLIVRDYARIDGVRVPIAMGSTADILLRRAIDVLDGLRVRIDQRRPGPCRRSRLAPSADCRHTRPIEDAGIVVRPVDVVQHAGIVHLEIDELTRMRLDDGLRADGRIRAPQRIEDRAPEDHRMAVPAVAGRAHARARGVTRTPSAARARCPAGPAARRPASRARRARLGDRRRSGRQSPRRAGPLGVRVDDQPHAGPQALHFRPQRSSSGRPTTMTSATPPSRSAAARWRTKLGPPGRTGRSAFGCPIRLDWPAARITPGITR